MPAPPWLSLLAPLPHDVVPQRKPVASAQQLANGTAGPIAGWQSITPLRRGAQRIRITPKRTVEVHEIALAVGPSQHPAVLRHLMIWAR